MDGQTVAIILTLFAVGTVIGTYLLGELAYRHDGMPE